MLVKSEVRFENDNPEMGRIIGMLDTLSDGSTRMRRVVRNPQGRPIGIEVAE
jgi:hypothetical protein